MEVDFCCNDPNNGLFTGKVSDFNIDLPCGEPLELSGPECRITVLVNRIKIGQKSFLFRNYREWVGNWCWNAATLEDEAVWRLVSYLRDVKKWTCQCGPTGLFDLINENRGEPLSREKWNDALKAGSPE